MHLGMRNLETYPTYPFFGLVLRCFERMRENRLVEIYIYIIQVGTTYAGICCFALRRLLRTNVLLKSPLAPSSPNPSIGSTGKAKRSLSFLKRQKESLEKETEQLGKPKPCKINGVTWIALKLAHVPEKITINK